MRNLYLLFLFFAGFYSFSQNDRKYWIVILAAIFAYRSSLIVYHLQHKKQKRETSRIHYRFFRYMRSTKIIDANNPF